MNETSYEEKARKEKAPLQYKLYKGVRGKFGAMRLNLKKAWSKTDPSIRKAEGCVFLEMAPATGPNIYDWQQQKMVIALSITDIPKIIMYLRMPTHQMFTDRKDPTRKNLKIYHDRGAGTQNEGVNTKTLKIDRPEGANNFFFSMYEKDKDVYTTATVTVSPDESIAIVLLLQSAVSKILAW